MNDSQPILVAHAQHTWRDRDASRSPLDALEIVSRSALANAACRGLLQSIDTVVTVPSLATQVPDLAGLTPVNTGSALCQRLGLQAETFSTDVGGNTPQLMVNYFADRLAAGTSKAVLVAGGELFATLFAALSSGQDISHWQLGGDQPAVQLGSPREPANAIEQAHGMFEPINTYPLFESALRHARGWDRETHLQRLGQLVSGMSAVAAQNPCAWRQEFLTPEQVLDTSAGNRMITWPYTKVMNAILAVDMAAAVIMTTVGEARRLGIDSEQWVYLRGGAEANDIWNVSERPVLHESPAIAACAGAALHMSGLSLDALDRFDLYSCFPSAVQVACEAIGLALDDPRGVTVTGGLTLFGGPGNNYSLHGIAEMVAQLQAGNGRHGMVTANGNYLTKHAVGVYSRDPGDSPWPLARPDLQTTLDAAPRLRVDAAANGVGTIDACAVAFDREGPGRGIVLGRMGDGSRFVANTPRGDAAALERLLADDPVGEQGRVTPGDRVNSFEF
ncbi:MAG: acetyl-CoA acetyltransferase [Haliea sp.]|uniref:acetyl-CoA acetyltransferase n=1 Tax=Haliea sp. TaxID=1932666 RepID=UPI0032F0962F